MKVSVDDLLKKPFFSRSMTERLRIIEEGKPRPALNMAAVVTASDDDNGGLQTYQFREAMYDEVQWLTGCDKRHTFFCWPCLLFMPGDGLWNTTGVGDFVYYLEGMPQHEDSFEHMQSMMKLTNMIEVTAKTSNIDATQHNEMVKRNRAIFKRMIDVLCNILVLEQHSAERNNGCQLDPENFVKNLKFLRTYDVLNFNFIEDAIDIIKIKPNIVNDLVDTIVKKIKVSIKKEIESSTYVSVILTYHSKISEKPQISTVLRYIKRGSKVCERFVGFLNTSGERSASAVFEHISNIVTEFSFTGKFLGLALDGGVLKTADLVEFTLLVKDAFPYTFFVPWYCHGLDNVLQQSLAAIKDCSAFFKSINEMKVFLGKKSKRYKALDGFMREHLPNSKDTKWFGKNQFIQLTQSYRLHFITFFNSMVENSAMWEPDDVTKALGFGQILADFDTIFFLEAFSMLFDHTAALNKILKSNSPENIFSGNEVTTLLNELAALRYKFDELWRNANDPKKRATPWPDRKKLKLDPDDPRTTKYQELYYSIVDSMIQEISTRFLHLSNLSFCQLFNSDKFGNFIFTNEMVQLYSTSQGAYFDHEQIKNEAIVLRTNGSVFSKKSIYDMLDFFTKTKLKDAFKYLYKLAEFVLALPLKATTAKGDLSKLKDIKVWSYSPDTAGAQPGDVSIASVEVDFLQELKKSSFFHDDVAGLFCEINNNTFELTSK